MVNISSSIGPYRRVYPMDLNESGGGECQSLDQSPGPHTLPHTNAPQMRPRV